MNWALLLLLACPLMMLFCMKGMFSKDKNSAGSKAQATNSQAEQPQVSLQDVQSMQIQMADMMEKNHKLMKEIKSMKEQQNTEEPINAQIVQEPESNTGNEEVITVFEKETAPSEVVVNINKKQEEADSKRKTS